jgi:PKD repeat protein
MKTYFLFIKTLFVSVISIALLNGCRSEEPVVVAFNAIPTVDSLTGETIITFENNSQGGIAYKWDFGDGETSNLFLPRDTVIYIRDANTVDSIVRDSIHLYQQSGTYSISLTVVGNDQTQSLTKSVFIPGIKADFEVDTTSFDKDNSVTFSLDANAKKINGATYTWNFGDGVESVQKDKEPVRHVYNNGGIYVVQLTTQKNNSIRQSSKIVNLPALDVNFTATPLPSDPKTVTFTPNLKNAANVTEYTWDLGDNTIKNDVSTFNHSYASGGPYLVKLSVKQGNDIKSVTRSINIPSLEVDFQTSFRDANKKIVTFEPKIKNGATTDEYSWDFGDNVLLPNASNGIQTHAYKNGGTFTVTLTVKQGDDEKSVSKSVNVPALAIDFVANFNDPNKKIVTFVPAIQNSTNTDEYTWEFGDNTSDTRTNDDSFIHTYANGGIFNVKLSVKQGNDTKVVTKSVNIPTLIVDFNVAFNNPDKKNVTFIPVIQNGISTDEYTWDFGDNTLENRPNGNSFIYTYANGGVYSVKLSVKQGNDIKTVTKSISIPSLKADFNFTVSNFYDITFNNTSLNADGATFLWDFGDGNTSINASTSHRYETGGIYNVKLTVTQGSEEKTITKTVSVPVLLPNFKFEISDFTVTLDANLSVNALAGATYTWDLGDGQTRTGKTINYTYTNGGVFDVVLTINQGAGLESKTISKQVVLDKVIPDFAVSIPSNCPSPCQVTFTNTSQNLPSGATYAWNFGDGSGTNTLASPQHAYSNGGTFTVTLVITINGTEFTAQKSITVPSITASFNIIGGDCQAPCTVTLQNNSTNVPAGYTYHWDYGTGTGEVPNNNPSHIAPEYANAGVYTINLIIKNGGNEVIRTQKSVTINSASSQPINLYQSLNAHYTFNNTLRNIVGSNTADKTTGGNIDYSYDRKGSNNRAFEFDGNTILDTEIPLPNTSNVSISFWMKPSNNYAGSKVIFDNNQQSITHNGTTLLVKDGTFSSNYNINTGFAWSHFVVIFKDVNGSKIVEVYQNGVLAGSGTWTGIIGSNDLMIGGKIDGLVSEFEGWLDDVRIYGRALNQSEVTALYQE